MIQDMYRGTPLLLIGTLCLAGTVGHEVTPTELDRAVRYLDSTRDALVESVHGLSDAQLKFKPAPDRWSVAEVVEHLALLEDAVHGIILNLDKAPAPPAGWDAKQVDALILSQVPDRTTKVKAPEAAVPTGRWTPEAALQHFMAARASNIALLRSTPDLRDHVVKHPVFGPMDGYQWLLAVAAHSERHNQQVLEVKNDPHFPAR
jgi:hypothetical protein